MKLSEIFKNRKREKQMELNRLVDYLNNHMFDYYEKYDKLQKENRNMQKKLTKEYGVLQQKYVFDKMSEYTSLNIGLTDADINRYEEKCLKKLDNEYALLKKQAEEEFSKKNESVLEFIKSYSSKLKQYEKLQVELKVQVPLKKYVPLNYINNDRSI